MRLTEAIRSKRSKMTMRAQLSLALLATLIVMAAALLIYIYNSRQNHSITEQTESLQRLLESESESIDSYFTKLTEWSIQLRNDASFMSLLTVADPGFTQLQTLENSVRTFFNARRDILELRVIIPAGNLCLKIDSNGRKVTAVNMPDVTQWTDYASFASGPSWLTIRPYEGAKLHITRTIVDVPRDTPIAYIDFYVSDTEFAQYERSHAMRSEQFWLTDAAGTVYSSNSNAISIDEGSKEYLFVSSSYGSCGFQLHCAKSMRAVLSDSVKELRGALILAALIILFSAIIMLALIRVLTRPLAELSERVHGIGAGDFTAKPVLSGSSDIFGLSEDVNRMLAGINELIDRNYVSSLNERTAQLAALRAQTNPHFLFNTLQAIGAQALDNGDIRVYDMVTALASLLRYSIRGGDLAELSEDIEITKDYLMLQKERFGDRLSYEINTDTGVQTFPVPRLGLLSLVENSIVHGMRDGANSILIKIFCVQKDEKLTLAVEDNGRGMTPQQLAELRERLENSSVIATERIGLSNLISRLRLLYGTRFTYSIDSVSAGSEHHTRVEIQILKEGNGNAQSSDRR